MKLLSTKLERALRMSPQVSIASLKTRLGHSDHFVRKGVACPKAMGLSRVNEAADGALTFDEGGIPDEELAMRIEQEIGALREETSAFRRHSHSASTKELLLR